jgi:hypothetical protein
VNIAELDDICGDMSPFGVCTQYIGISGYPVGPVGPHGPHGPQG